MCADGNGYPGGLSQFQSAVQKESADQGGGILEDVKWLAEMFLDALREWEKNGELYIDELARMSWEERKKRWANTPPDAPASSVGEPDSTEKRYGPGTALAHDQGHCFPNCGYCKPSVERFLGLSKDESEAIKIATSVKRPYLWLTEQISREELRKRYGARQAAMWEAWQDALNSLNQVDATTVGMLESRGEKWK